MSGGTWLAAFARAGMGAAICGAGAGTAHAAETTAASTEGLQEVIVTAQKRAENVQSVPLSITTFESQELQQKAITLSLIHI